MVSVTPTVTRVCALAAMPLLKIKADASKARKAILILFLTMGPPQTIRPERSMRNLLQYREKLSRRIFRSPG
jgi:hypothetical protein